MSSINQAKAEAQKLIKRYNKLQAEAKTADAAEASRKASEAEKLVSQISALQAAITKLQAKDRQQLPAAGTSTAVRPIGKTDATDEGMTPEELKRAAEEKALLEARIARIESAQQRTRAQIEQLSRAKQELARLKHEAEQNAAREKREQDERLQQELAKLIEKKENEQETLRRELDNIRQQAEKDAELLRIQRDAARATAEKHKQEQAVNRSLGIVRRKSNNGIWIGLGVGIVLAGGLVAVALFTNLLDDYLPHKKTPITAGNAPPIQTAPTGNAIAENTANQISPTSSNAQSSAPALPTATEAVPVKALGEFQDSLRSGGRGPMMVKLPGGTFLMGSRDSLPYTDEKPQHQVTLNNYSISKFEVTFTDYDRFVRATDYASPDDMGWGRSNRPVVNVTWDDAVEYTKWLSTETGKLYRLPSEREWEYAAKAGTDSTYWWGMDLIPNRANCGVCGSEWDGRQTAPIGSFQANEFGLHDTIGNVLEWTLDCARPTYDNAPPTGQFWEGGDCSRRVVRSSSYRSFKANLRTTKREMYPSKRKSDTLGFRVVRVE